MIVVAGEGLVDLIVEASGAVRAMPGGGPFNAARTIGRLGRPVSFVGRLSTDRFGRLLRRSLEADGVATDDAASTDAPTTLAVAELDDHGAATYRFYLDGTSAPGLTVEEATRGIAADAMAVYLGSLGLVLEPLATSLEAALEGLAAGTLVMVDVNCRPSVTPDAAAYRSRVRRILGRTHAVKVSVDDLAFLAPGVEPHVAARTLLDEGPTAALLTAGARPAVVITASETRSLSVPRVRVVDSVGAGDAFGGAFLAWWDARALRLEDLSDADELAAAAAFAVRVAAVTCERPGAEPPTLEELGGLG